jgi:hypothetical protein
MSVEQWRAEETRSRRVIQVHAPTVGDAVKADERSIFESIAAKGGIATAAQDAAHVFAFMIAVTALPVSDTKFDWCPADGTST